MTSIGGRISSARLLRSARAHRVKLNVNPPDPNDNFELRTIKSFNRDETLKNIYLKENEEAKKFFKILTPEMLEQKKQLLKERKEKIKENKNKQKEKDKVKGTGKLVDGKIVYEDNKTNFQDNEINIRDPTLEEGNQLPERFGIFSTELLHKPLVELGI